MPLLRSAKASTTRFAVVALHVLAYIMPGGTFAGLGLSVIGLGTQYPAHSLQAADVDALSKRFYTDSPA